MTAERSENELEFPFEPLALRVHAQRGRLSANQRIKGARALVAALRWDEPARSPWNRFQLGWGTRWAAAWGLLLALATASATAGVVLAVHHRASRPLSFTIDGGQVERNGFIQAGTAMPPRLHFSDGSELFLDHGARASLSEVDGRGARVALTEGARASISSTFRGHDGCSTRAPSSSRSRERRSRSDGSRATSSWTCRWSAGAWRSAARCRTDRSPCAAASI